MCSAILHEIVVDTNLIIPYLCLDQLPQHNTCTAKINKIHLTQLQQFYCISTKTMSLYWTINMIWQFILEFFLHVQTCIMHTYIIALKPLCTFTNIILRVFTEIFINDQQQMFCIQCLTSLNHYFDHLTQHWSHFKISSCLTTS